MKIKNTIKNWFYNIKKCFNNFGWWITDILDDFVFWFIIITNTVLILILLAIAIQYTIIFLL
jgi:hypothetical protein